jgi:hypothetical protein
MLKVALALVFTLFTATLGRHHHGHSIIVANKLQNCITFTVGQGTGCVWMCNYCAEQLGTNNYYFTDGVCQYQTGVGCVGSPSANYEYTCCSG